MTSSAVLGIHGLLAGLLLALLVACGAPGPAPLATRGDPVPLLYLSPAALGQPLALRQRITATARGAVQQFEVLLECDAQSVRMALLQFGQAGARLEWDGVRLRQPRSAALPPGFGAEAVLNDLQLMYWPAAAIDAALPGGWRFEATPMERRLLQGDERVLVSRTVAEGRRELHHLRLGYDLIVESQPLE